MGGRENRLCKACPAAMRDGTVQAGGCCRVRRLAPVPGTQFPLLGRCGSIGRIVHGGVAGTIAVQERAPTAISRPSSAPLSSRCRARRASLSFEASSLIWLACICCLRKFWITDAMPLIPLAGGGPRPSSQNNRDASDGLTDVNNGTGHALPWTGPRVLKREAELGVNRIDRDVIHRLLESTGLLVHKRAPREFRAIIQMYNHHHDLYSGCRMMW